MGGRIDQAFSKEYAAKVDAAFDRGEAIVDSVRRVELWVERDPKLWTEEGLSEREQRLVRLAVEAAVDPVRFVDELVALGGKTVPEQQAADLGNPGT